jgi:flagellar biosynthetic protein FliR
MISVGYLVLLGLIFTRISGLFILLPVFSSRNVTTVVKVGILFFISIAVAPVVALKADVQVNSFLELAYHLFVEFAIGLSFGMVMVILLSSIYLAGSIVDRNLGFSMVNVISPLDESNMPVSANIYYLFAMLIYLFTDGHHMMIRGIVESMQLIPVGGGLLNPLIVMDFVELFGQAFVIGVRLSAPFIITTMVANIILGMLSKAMPGMNVFMIGMPFKIFVGLTLFSLIMPVYYNSFIELYKMVYNYLFDMIRNYL